MPDSSASALRLKLFAAYIKDGSDSSAAGRLMAETTRRGKAGMLDSRGTAEWLLHELHLKGWRPQNVAAASLEDLAAIVVGPDTVKGPIASYQNPKDVHKAIMQAFDLALDCGRDFVDEDSPDDAVDRFMDLKALIDDLESLTDESMEPFRRARILTKSAHDPAAFVDRFGALHTSVHESALEVASWFVALASEYVQKKREIETISHWDALRIHAGIGDSRIDSDCSMLVLFQEMAAVGHSYRQSMKAESAALEEVGSPESAEASPHTYLPSQIAQRLDISPPTLNKYAKEAGVKTPGQGQRDFRYTFGNCISILTYISEHGSTTDMISRAKDFLKEIQKKPKAPN